MSGIHIKNDVIAYLEKTLLPEKQKKIEEHLSSCSSCQAFVKRMSAVYFSGDKQEVPELTPYFYTRVCAQLEKEQQSTWEIPLPVLRSLRPVAAGLFVLTAITFTIFLSNYIISGNQFKMNTKVGSSEMSYEYYLENSGDLMLNTIVSNEN